MRILITGSQGFIGQNMVTAMSRHHDVLTFEWGEPTPSVDGVDWVIHLGAISSTVETNVEKILAQNLDFSIWLYQQCCTHSVNLQWASSASVYGSNNVTFLETDQPQPQSPYAWSKFLFERYIRQNPCNHVKVQAFRYFNVYGAHEDHKGAQASPYHQFAQQAKKGAITLYEGSKEYMRDFVPVEYVVDVHQQFLDIDQSGIWNIGTGKPQSFYSIAAQFNVPIIWKPMPDHIAKHYQSYTCANTQKLLSTLSTKKQK